MNAMSLHEINVPKLQKTNSKQNRNESLKSHRKKGNGRKATFCSSEREDEWDLSGRWSEKKTGKCKGDAKKELRKTKRTSRSE